MNLKGFINRLFLSVIIVLVILICSKKSISFKNNLYNNVYNKTISFAYLNTIYNKYLGDVLPFKLNIGVTPVFNETLKYKNAIAYLDGAKLDVDLNYLVPSLTNGLVIFEGDKESLGKTIIVLDEFGVETWYSNINNNVKLYDYVEKGSYIGDTLDNKLYLTFKKNGENLNYEEYLK